MGFDPHLPLETAVRVDLEAPIAQKCTEHKPSLLHVGAQGFLDVVHNQGAVEPFDAGDAIYLSNHSVPMSEFDGCEFIVLEKDQPPALLDHGDHQSGPTLNITDAVASTLGEVAPAPGALIPHLGDPWA